MARLASRSDTNIGRVLLVRAAESPEADARYVRWLRENAVHLMAAAERFEELRIAVNSWAHKILPALYVTEDHDDVEPCTFEDFRESNENMSVEDLQRVQNLRLWESVKFGGGASAEATIRRIR